ncbi:MAG: hypothetical protein COV10_01335 [Candidatus Vogelbacteria bacterium CG10_big_fil_rev_8_21_14_0_10_51_16]|uniref:Ig-like domain-containing protein n=1 Tax=Candidatus Vogelbacteria bacterium CG10_big_fil_rev_8_21_14_0_10_51_16 TaxID=1975045 RepID=A0A2H0RF40_9BACT|nr:MAG: hypothetical protein COV10_01335 [Candidatus Vogelbacteria bacterium CG10_big_fil_rev_8_21_14_0_10_51_16]
MSPLVTSKFLQLTTLSLLVAVLFSPQTASASSPFTITLESSFGSQSIAAGTKRVAMARYRIASESKGVFLLSTLALTRAGEADGLERCEMVGAGRTEAVPEGSDEQTERVIVSFAPPLEVRESSELALLCDISEDSVGKSYTWGLALDAPEVLISEEFGAITPTVTLARRPNGKPGANGQTFSVVVADISLNAAAISALVGESSAPLLPGEEAVQEVLIKNDGGVTWPAGVYRLLPDPSTDASLWSDDSEAGLPVSLAPGESHVVNIRLRAPADPREHKLGWVVALNEADKLGGLREQSGGTIVQTSQTTRRTVASPPQKESIIKRIVAALTPQKAPEREPSSLGGEGDGSPSGGLESAELAPGTSGTVERSSSPISASSATTGDEAPSLSRVGEQSEGRVGYELSNVDLQGVNLNESSVSSVSSDEVALDSVKSAESVSTIDNIETAPDSDPVVAGEGNYQDKEKDSFNPIVIAEEILQKILSLFQNKQVDYPALKAEARRLSGQLSAMALKDKNDTLAKTPITVAFPGGSIIIEFEENSFVVDARVSIEVKDPEEISRILAETPLPGGYGVLGQVLLGEFQVLPYDEVKDVFLAHPVKVSFVFNDPELSGFFWEQESLGVYRLAEDGKWRPVTGSEVLVYSKNSIVVGAFPNVNELGVLALVGKFNPPPLPQEGSAPRALGSVTAQAENEAKKKKNTRQGVDGFLQASVCSYFRFFGWPSGSRCAP